MTELNKMRQEYRSGNLDEKEMPSNPLDQFRNWFEEAISSGITEPNAMTVASSTAEGKPSARVVLLKEMNDNGFIFFTNYNSRKGHELITNPFVAVVFDWHDIERQVRIEGIIEKVDENESDAYFNIRPNESKLGAWASPQSKIVSGREELEELEKSYAIRFKGNEIPRPPHWGGFLIKPTMIEFWQGRPNRMHDRMAYYKNGSNWELRRLAP